ncbi:MAG TPA: OmpH family outer membrane protein, partial [Rhizomicrobium sp.]|nr:OmpH family outer membrane protein [Rhizomicrobium sp.]
HIAVLDRQVLMRNSAAGQSIAVQVRAITMTAETALRAENEALRRDGTSLQKRIPSLPPAEMTKAVQGFEARQKVFQAKVLERQAQIRAAVAAAQKKIEAAASPAVFAVLKDDQANFLLDGSAVIAHDDALDITPAVLAKLDTALPHVDVVLEAAEKK